MTTAYHSQNIFWVCDDMEGGVGCVEGRRVCLWLIHIVVGQKPTRCCKAISLQLQIEKSFKKNITNPAYVPNVPTYINLLKDRLTFSNKGWEGSL